MSIEDATTERTAGIGEGVYGLRLVGEDIPCSMLVPVGRRWPPVEVVRRRGGARSAPPVLGSDRTEFPLVGGGRLAIERAPRRAVFTTPEAVSDAELVHPYLAPVAATFARWDKREAFHAGGFVVEGRVWALVGQRASGKSSTLAWIALSGYQVLCDDLLITDSGVALAGPRCVDLRLPAARRLGIGIPLRRGRTQRWRLALDDVSAELPLAGWVFLEWGPDVSVERVPVAERLARLASHRSMMVEPTDPGALLELAALPAWKLTRPRTWESLAPVLTRLLELSAA